MDPQIASRDASLVRGYAWHAYPDPATPGIFADDDPFGSDELADPDRTNRGLPAGVLRFWKIAENTPGIANRIDGESYLVLSDSPEPPSVEAGWFVEAARLSERFELDQRGGRSVRLVRLIGTETTGWGAVAECEFQVDRA